MSNRTGLLALPDSLQLKGHSGAKEVASRQVHKNQRSSAKLSFKNTWLLEHFQIPSIVARE